MANPNEIIALLRVAGALALFVVAWNVLWGPTPKGTPWSVYLPRVLRTAGVIGVAIAVGMYLLMSR